MVLKERRVRVESFWFCCCAWDVSWEGGGVLVSMLMYFAKFKERSILVDQGWSW